MLPFRKGKADMKAHLTGCLVLMFGLYSLNVYAEDVSTTEKAQDSLVNVQSSEENESLYRLQEGDRVLLKIYPEDEFIKGGEMKLGSEGVVTIPLVGKVSVAGKTIDEAQKEITDVLAKDYLVDPEVVIEVLKYKKHSFSVIGQVKRPGTYEISPGTKSIPLLKAVSMAGGFSDIANIKKIKVMRKAGASSQVLKANAEAIIGGSEPDIDLEAGDVVHVSESLF